MCVLTVSVCVLTMSVCVCVCVCVCVPHHPHTTHLTTHGSNPPRSPQNQTLNRLVHFSFFSLCLHPTLPADAQSATRSSTAQPTWPATAVGTSLAPPPGPALPAKPPPPPPPPADPCCPRPIDPKARGRPPLLRSSTALASSPRPPQTRRSSC